MSISQLQLNGTKFWMKIDRFEHPLSSGRMFFSGKFKISESQFRIKVSTMNEGFVGVYLHSMNNWRVQCNFTIRARGREFNSGVIYIRPQGEAGNNWGISNFWSKKDSRINGPLSLEVDVQLLEEGRMQLKLEKKSPLSKSSKGAGAGPKSRER